MFVLSRGNEDVWHSVGSISITLLASYCRSAERNICFLFFVMVPNSCIACDICGIPISIEKLQDCSLLAASPVPEWSGRRP